MDAGSSFTADAGDCFFEGDSPRSEKPSGGASGSVVAELIQGAAATATGHRERQGQPQAAQEEGAEMLTGQGVLRGRGANGEGATRMRASLR